MFRYKDPVLFNFLIGLTEKEMSEQGGFSIFRHEMRALLRHKGPKNYRECGDQILRYFLKRHTKRVKQQLTVQP